MTGVRLGDVVNDEPGAVAATCASLGWRVFPLRPDNGNPAIQSWPERATSDRNLIEEWWGWQFPGHGVGIATGLISGIWVLDLDVKDGLNGVSDWAELVLANSVVPKTFTAMTRNGGSHLYWQWPDGEVEVRNSAKRIAPGIDVRGEGGYVRAPVKQSDILVPVHPVEAPPWLLKKALAASKPRASRGEPASRPSEWTSARDALRYAGARLSLVASGGRNDALNRASFLLARWAPETKVTRDDAWRAMLWACKQNGLWAEEPEGCTATFASGWNAGAAAAEDRSGEQLH